MKVPNPLQLSEHAASHSAPCDPSGRAQAIKLPNVAPTNRPLLALNHSKLGIPESESPSLQEKAPSSKKQIPQNPHDSKADQTKTAAAGNRKMNFPTVSPELLYRGFPTPPSVSAGTAWRSRAGLLSHQTVQPSCRSFSYCLFTRYFTPKASASGSASSLQNPRCEWRRQPSA